MVAYREIVESAKDIEHIANMLKELKGKNEVIIVPLESDDKELQEAQEKSMETTWNNKEDEGWDEL